MKQAHQIQLDKEHQEYWELLKKNGINISELIREALKKKTQELK